MNKKDIFNIILVFSSILLCGFLLSGVWGKGLSYCFQDEHTAKYYFDSWCFNMNYRCDVECSRYDLDFSGVIEGCNCDCIEGWVSSCSGFYYESGTDNVFVRYTGDEICEYGNGTIESCGYEAGIVNITDRTLRWGS